MSLALDKPHIFESKFKSIKLVATEFDEPFYGFTLWRFRLYVDDNLLMNPLAGASVTLVPMQIKKMSRKYKFHKKTELIL